MSNLKKLKKRYTVKIPKNISLLYCDKKNMITLVGPLQIKSLKLKVKSFLIPDSQLIVVTQIPFSNISSGSLKNSKKLQGTTVSKIKQAVIEVSYTLYNKLNLVGVGYRVFAHERLPNQIYLKIGYSHLVYFKIPNDLNSFCQKFTKLFLFGNCSFDLLTHTAAQIRSCKLPEPYKGKGVLYDQEKVMLKKGKKI
uniref:Ribosomal protein L6 n=1 Tax=Codium fragile TaxID=3133 RepID=A0A6M3QTZ6_CODFR|nr:ribosomal protein L6 [Codium fragile]QJC59749.1 ribosomal protein L6 [Codium fragile]